MAGPTPEKPLPTLTLYSKKAWMPSAATNIKQGSEQPKKTDDDLSGLHVVLGTKGCSTPATRASTSTQYKN